MFSELGVARNRVRLARMLREKGVYVRLHAYEYLLGYGGRILGVLLLEPSRGSASLFLRGEGDDAKRLAEIVGEVLDSLDPGLRLSVVWAGSG